MAISLEIKHEQGTPECPRSTVSFDLAWDCLTSAESADESFWLAVETQLDDADAQDREYKQSTDESVESRLVTSLRKIDVHASSSGISDPSNPPDNQKASNTSVPLIRDICTEIRRQHQLQPQQKQENYSSHQCIGLLHDPGNSKHLLFRGPGNNSSRVSMSLQDALRKARTLVCGIPPVDRMHLARTLSVAVLQLHPTPWLDKEWCSEDILFFGIQDLNKESLEAPYLSTHVIASSEANCRRKISSPSALVPNIILYSLGIILIELAFERPLTDMLELGDSVPGEPVSIALHRAAIRLADVIGKKVHVGYERVVKRCLWCNFETRSMHARLEDQDLQEAFYKFVVCELDRCFRAVAMF